MSFSTFAIFTRVIAVAACACGCGRSAPASSSSDGAPMRATPVASGASIDAGASGASSYFSGCEEQKRDGFVFFGCGPPRAVVRMKLPEMTEEIFEVNARRFFEPFPGAATPVKTTLSLASGVKARAMESTVKASDAGNKDAVLMAVGVFEADGSGVFMGCSGYSAASCKADIEALYVYDRH